MEASRGRRASCEPRHHVWITEHIALTRSQRLHCGGMANHFNPHPGGRWVYRTSKRADTLLAGRQGGRGRALTTIRSAVLACTLSARLSEALLAAPQSDEVAAPSPSCPILLSHLADCSLSRLQSFSKLAGECGAANACLHQETMASKRSPHPSHSHCHSGRPREVSFQWFLSTVWFVLFGA